MARKKFIVPSAAPSLTATAEELGLSSVQVDEISKLVSRVLLPKSVKKIFAKRQLACKGPKGKGSALVPRAAKARQQRRTSRATPVKSAAKRA